MPDIKYPYLPEGRTIKYVPETHPGMIIAREEARRHSLDKVMPTGSIVVKDARILGRGANGSDYHTKHECERIRRQCPTGIGYELCEGCHPKNHSETKAILDAHGRDTMNADLYLWGHWWCCQWCWDTMIEAGIANVFLVKNSEVLFNKEHSDNIVGRQFTA
ncbi:MAG: hypothetical protein A2651_04140 [Candidatus Yanofskybacteria bacterium RIFCSPHIGHO2_01_FULL_42_12]|uniref:CMP/dCMP-type deaminase domain-containing protein n=1 Tax=Candidatus Yanofskybacteria bacterium RIFCSPLOWO2_01_FULL_42_49 TaxID=1802694 RepID=A0A1F8GB19_9BACT|nr:MAG: hypothetical protein A2651_04140 [Candidatus Yanofskybacteria bacterium RIFCSPHIGHO2_01_FULL_42_12]OGN22582.1 MAG: hypothetical protein A2918_02365 [Candidatus Yanofskybacteria bacterium RIFCSPLOWO2_01_FULL_42_49]